MVVYSTLHIPWIRERGMVMRMEVGVTMGMVMTIGEGDGERKLVVIHCDASQVRSEVLSMTFQN